MSYERRKAFQEVLDMINRGRDDGNIFVDVRKGFSPAIMLSEVIKKCEEELK